MTSLGYYQLLNPFHTKTPADYFLLDHKHIKGFPHCDSSSLLYISLSWTSTLHEISFKVCQIFLVSWYNTSCFSLPSSCANIMLLRVHTFVQVIYIDQDVEWWSKKTLWDSIIVLNPFWECSFWHFSFASFHWDKLFSTEGLSLWFLLGDKAFYEVLCQMLSSCVCLSLSICTVWGGRSTLPTLNILIFFVLSAEIVSPVTFPFTTFLDYNSFLP